MTRLSGIKLVKDMFRQVREKFPEVTDDMLVENGAIYYMNGNDGTNFDWGCNDRMCEFFIFWKETQYGFIKICVAKDNTAYAYVYKTPTEFYGEEIELGSFPNANGLRKIAYKNADCLDKWDCNINEIEWR